MKNKVELNYYEVNKFVFLLDALIEDNNDLKNDVVIKNFFDFVNRVIGILEAKSQKLENCDYRDGRFFILNVDTYNYLVNIISFDPLTNSELCKKHIK